MADDFREIFELADDISDAPARTRPFARKAVEFTARNVKDDWRKGARRTGLGGYAASVDYDITMGMSSTIEAEIGPNLGKKQGALGLVEDAPGGVRSAPQHAGRDALDKNLEDFYEGLEKAVADGTEGI